MNYFFKIIQKEIKEQFFSKKSLFFLFACFLIITYVSVKYTVPVKSKLDLYSVFALTASQSISGVMLKFSLFSDKRNQIVESVKIANKTSVFFLAKTVTYLAISLIVCVFYYLILMTCRVEFHLYFFKIICLVFLNLTGINMTSIILILIGDEKTAGYFGGLGFVFPVLILIVFSILFENPFNPFVNIICFICNFHRLNNLIPFVRKQRKLQHYS